MACATHVVFQKRLRILSCSVANTQKHDKHFNEIYPTPQYYLLLDNVTEKHKKNSVCSSISPANRTSTIIGIRKNMLWHYKTKKLKLPITYNIDNSFCVWYEPLLSEIWLPDSLSDCPTNLFDCQTNLSHCPTNYLTARLTYLIAQQTYLIARLPCLTARLTYLTARLPFLTARLTYLATRLTYLIARLPCLTAWLTCITARLPFLTARLPSLTAWPTYLRSGLSIWSID